MSEKQSEELLRLTDISKGLYDANGRTLNSEVKVLKNVSFSVNAHEVHILLGENGAGKSTLMKVLCGAISADEGEINRRGSRVKMGSIVSARELGIGLVAQELSLCPNLTVAQNIVLGREPTKRRGVSLNHPTMRAIAEQQLTRLGVEIDVDTIVDSLSIAQQQLVEIAKALSLNPSILILDEPTSALADNQVGQLFRVINALVEQGVGIVYITHKLREVFEVGNRVTVLRDGMTVGSKAVSEVGSSDELVRLMVGKELEGALERSGFSFGDTALEVENLTRAGVFRDLSLYVRDRKSVV